MEQTNIERLNREVLALKLQMDKMKRFIEGDFRIRKKNRGSMAGD